MPLPAKDELNLSSQLLSSRSGSNTATIPGPDFPVFTTDSSQSPWIPSSSSSLPAHSAQQLQLQHLDLPPHQQDFVLFDQPNHRPLNHRSVSQPSANGGVNQPQQHRNATLHNQRVANIIRAPGHPTTSSAFTNRFSSPNQNPRSQQQQQFYASSAPSSSIALNIPKQQHRQTRPPVPLFPQGTGSVPQAKMNIQGNYLSLPPLHNGQQRLHRRPDLDLEDFTAFEGGASTTAFSSPAHPAVFDLSSSVGTNLATISPQDLLIHEPFMSAPNSTALTALTSPSIYNESPDFCESYDVSPNFGSSDFDGINGNEWFPLFPEANAQPPAPVPTNESLKAEQSSPATASEELEGASPAIGGHRRKSSTSPGGRHSSVAGVNSRRRDKPLPPIIIDDPSDVVAMKRARNTLAARKSRERKAQRLDELEEKIEKLVAERDHWRNLALAHGAKE
ncbi:cross-pathway control protein 1 [Cladorrhinum sp. PSN259]|nr:cross-pathway control protein 1 [Cladorrhinum sp. PSN259]